MLLTAGDIKKILYMKICVLHDLLNDRGSSLRCSQQSLFLGSCSKSVNKSCRVNFGIERVVDCADKTFCPTEADVVGRHLQYSISDHRTSFMQGFLANSVESYETPHGDVFEIILEFG
jgi:hypothetical protein